MTADPPIAPKPRKFRPWIPLIIVVAIAGVIVYHDIQMTHLRGAFRSLLPILGAVLIWLWWTFLTGGGALRKAVWFFGGIIVLGLLAVCFRYEGSQDGTAAFKFVWRWSDREGKLLEEVEAQQVQEEGLAEMAHGGELRDASRLYGPIGDGVVPGVILSTNWEEKPPEMLWNQPIGMGWSGFSVAGQRAITQEQRGEEEWVSCYDLANGALLWKHINQTRFDVPMGGIGPRATPTIVDGKVYALGATGIFDCLDLETGELLWTRNVLEDGAPVENIRWGKSCSPLVYEEKVVISGGSGAGPTLLAYHRDTGEVLWTGGEDSASYSSPVLATVAGVRQIFSVNQNSVTGHDPESGAVLWSFPWEGIMPKVGQPQVVGEDQVLVTCSYDLDSHLLKLTPSGDGKLQAEAVWSDDNLRTKFSTALVKDGYAYGLSEGIFTCIDLATGERVWKGGRYGFGQNLLVGNVILVTTERGDVVLLEATPEEHRELAEFKAIDGVAWNPPALAGAFLLVRSEKEAACLRLPLAEELGEVTSAD